MKYSTLFRIMLGACVSAGSVTALAQAPEPSISVKPALAAAVQTLDFREVISRAKDKVFPAVVYIRALRENLERGERVSEEVSGSGVVISPDGEVITNWHVVDKATRVRCLLSDGRHFDAEVLGTDKDTDLALLRLRRTQGEDSMPHATLGDSSTLAEGDFVMAMGAPWGLNRSVSIGIIACVRRFLPEASEYSLWLQTDASISPGNSGGPLVNTAGEVIGINARGTIMGGDLGFAVPAETVRFVASQLRTHGVVKWSWTGLQLQALRDFNRNMYFDGTQGVVVSGTDPESPARRAGFLPRDRILAVNDEPLTALTEEDLPAVRRLLGLLPKGTPARFAVLRDGQELTVELTPREKGRVEGEELDCPRWDLTVKVINQFDNADLHFYRPEGVFIYGIKDPGNAANSDLRVRDIVVRIDGKEVKTLADVAAIHKEALANMERKSRVVFTVMRGGQTRQVVLDFARDYKRD